MIYLSATSIKDFISCSQKVLYRRTKPFPEILSKEMIIGTIAHKAIEIGWRDRDKAYSVASSMMKEQTLAKKDRTQIEFCIDIFFLNFKGLLAEDDQIEYNFKLKLHDDIYLVGKMDRISNGNVFDWKTGRVPSKLSNDVQCIIYDYAYQKIFNKQASSICVGALTTGQLLPYQRNELYTREIFERIIPRMIKTIKTESYERLGMFNHSCFRCPYRLGCLGKTEEGDAEYVVDSSFSPE